MDNPSSPVGPPFNVHHTLVKASELLEERGGEIQVVEARAGWAGVGDGGNGSLASVRDGNGLATVVS